MDKNILNLPWKNKIINTSQIGGIETSVLDNGPGASCRIAWINTGSGLRYKVVIDRSLDIAEAFYNQYSLAWLSHIGVTVPQVADYDLEWLYTFGGGLLTTCGLSHIGPPENHNIEHRGLHGRVSNLRATVESVNQPDLLSGSKEISITGLVKESKLTGPNLELKRTILSMLGESKMRICDTVTNKGNLPSPHMILYHFNLGWPLVDDTSEIVYAGHCKPRGTTIDGEVFNTKENCKRCMSPHENFNGVGEACGFIDVFPDFSGMCHIGIYNPTIKILLAIRYNKNQLPCLTNWQHWGYGEYVTGLEPGTNPPIGQNEAKKQGKLMYLEPQDTKTYELEIEILSKQDEIDDFILRIGDK